MVLRRLRGMLRTVVALGAAAFVLASAEAAEPPRRIVSLNLCTDQLLLDLVEPKYRWRQLSRHRSDAVGGCGAAGTVQEVEEHAKKFSPSTPIS